MDVKVALSSAQTALYLDMQSRGTSDDQICMPCNVSAINTATWIIEVNLLASLVLVAVVPH